MSQSYVIESSFVEGNLSAKRYLDNAAQVVADTGSDLAELYDHMASHRFGLKRAMIRTVGALAVSFAIGQLLVKFVA